MDVTAELARDLSRTPLQGGAVVSAPFIARAGFEEASAAQALEADWRDLSENAVERNPFYSPALLIPALDAFADTTVRLAVARDARGRMIALAPVAPARGYSRLPVSYLTTWMHEHCFFAAPLIRAGAEEEAFTALFDLFANEGAFFRFRRLAASGPLAKAARRAADARGVLIASSAHYERAMLEGGFVADDVLTTAYDGKKRKELRRQRARLDDEGCVAFESFSAGDDLAIWAEEFLALEQKGWKGREGTALASNASSRRFFVEALNRAHSAGVLDFHRLNSAGRPVAMIVNFIDGGEGYSFKIAFDEDYAKFSPGVLLEIEMLRALEGRRLAFIDSCAARDHPMINALWRERRAIEALNVSGASVARKVLFRLLTAIERAGETLRRGKR